MNVYLISAEAYHIIDLEVKKIIKDNNYLTFNMNKSSISELIEEASYFSIDDKKYIVASNADFFGSGKLNEKDAELLQNYLDKPNPGTVLIFTTLVSLDSRKKPVKKIKELGNVINIPKSDKSSLNRYITDYLKKNSYSADYQTINYIMDNSYSNLDIIYNELDKIMLYYNKPCQIKFDDVVNIVGEELDNNNFHFVNAVITKDQALALKLFKNLQVYKVEPLSLIILLAREYRLMYYVKNLHEKMSLNGIINYLHLADWQINKLYMNSMKFSNEELLQNLVKLCKMDINIKKGIWDKEVALYNFLIDACE